MQAPTRTIYHPVLWSAEYDRTAFLARWLAAFEQILTGIDDGVDFTHPPLDQVIDWIPELFDPWRVEKRFLPMLASWVGLTLDEAWGEYQCRQLISTMISIYLLGGSSEGLYTYLDIYAQSEARPRIAVDDGEALFRINFQEDGAVQLHTLAYSRSMPNPGRDIAVLLHPTALAIDQENFCIVADGGGQEDIKIDEKTIETKWQPALWKVSNTGEIPFAVNVTDEALPEPAPIFYGEPLANPVAVVVDTQNRYAVLDIGNEAYNDGIAIPNSRLLLFTQPDPEMPPKFELSTLIDQSTNPSLPAIHPVDMVLHPSGYFIILDRTMHNYVEPKPGLELSRIIVVEENGSTVHQFPLKTIVYPTAIVMEKINREDNQRSFIVADARAQKVAEEELTQPYSKEVLSRLLPDLVRVRFDPSNPESEVIEEPLLGSNEADHIENPLIFPNGLVFESPHSLLVCDTGLKEGYYENPSNRLMAEQAAIYRIDLSDKKPRPIKIKLGGRLVYPTKMMFDRQENLILADRGETFRREMRVEWRNSPHSFGVVVHFSQERPTNIGQRNEYYRLIDAVVEKHRPGHTSWWLEF